MTIAEFIVWLPNLFSDLGNAIRSKTGGTDKILPQSMASAIRNINLGTDTSDATLNSNSQLPYGVIAYSQGTKYTGSAETLTAQTWTPTTSDQLITPGKYVNGTQTIKGDPNLISRNIRYGATIFGVSGTAVEASGDVTDIINISRPDTSNGIVVELSQPASTIRNLSLVYTTQNYTRQAVVTSVNTANRCIVCGIDGDNDWFSDPVTASAMPTINLSSDGLTVSVATTQGTDTIIKTTGYRYLTGRITYTPATT